MATKIRLLKNAGIPFYPQTVDKAIYVGSKNKTLDTVLADLAAADVTVDTVLNVASGNPIANKTVKVELDKKLNTVDFTAKVGAAKGICPLDENAKIEATYLPSYVDDIIDLVNFISATPTSAGIYYNTVTKKLEHYESVMPGTVDLIKSTVPESGKIYVNTSNNKQYRWSGTTLAVVSETLALGETASTAYPGNNGKINADNILMLTGRVDNIEGKANEQDDAIIEIRGIANANKATILAHAKEYTALNNSLTAEKAKTVTLQSKMGTAETNISNLTTSVQSLNTGLGSANTNIDTVKTRVATIEAAYITCQDTGGEVAYSIPAGIYQ